MSISARILLAISAMLLAATVAAAAVFSCDGRQVDASRPDAHPAASPTAVFVSPAPVAFDLESDSPADL